MKIVLAVLLVVALAAGGFFGWRAWSARGAGAPGSAVSAVTDVLGSLAAKATGGGPPDDSPVRCRVGKQVHLLRRLDCAQRQGEVVAGGGGVYTKLTKEEYEAQFGKPPTPAAPPSEEQPPAAQP